MSDNVAVRLTRRLVTVHEADTADGEAHDGRLTRRIDGRFGVTPLFIAVAVILSVDLVFALDSIPAIFGITQNAYLVFTANAFALLGLRALYFLLVGLLDRLVHLSYGLAFILAFIGVKLILLYLHEDVSTAIPAVPTWLSLLVIVATLAIVTVTSLVATRGGEVHDEAPDGAVGPAGSDAPAEPGPGPAPDPAVARSEHDGTGSPTRRP
jgi:tellurite resistance protein TerC